MKKEDQKCWSEASENRAVFGGEKTEQGCVNSEILRISIDMARAKSKIEREIQMLRTSNILDTMRSKWRLINVVAKMKVSNAWKGHRGGKTS